MRRFFLALLIISLVAIGCSRPSGEQSAESTATTPLPIQGVPYGDFVIGKPVTCNNLTLFAVASRVAKNDDRFITLDEGLAAGTVKIIEVGAEANNVSDDDPFAEDTRTEETSTEDTVAQDTVAVDTVAVDTVVEDGLPEDTSHEDESVANSAPEQSIEQQTNQDVDDLFGELGTQLAGDEQVEEAIPVEEDFDPFGDSESEEEVTGNVNQLLVLNTSGKPLYLMPGEVISGGKQDRTIGHEVVIKSGEDPVPIGVFCVEQGRWQGRSVAQLVDILSAEGATLSADVANDEVSEERADLEAAAKAANDGEFVASVGQVSKDVRLAVQAQKAQGAVWESVGKLNSFVGNDSESSNLTVCFSNGQIAENLSQYIEQLNPVGDTNQIVGVAVAVNGKMLSVDVFESTPLFRKMWPKLLKSYALDAVAAAGEKSDAEPSPRCTIDECLVFVAEAHAGKTEANQSEDGAVVSRTDSQAAASFAFYDAEVAEETGIADSVATGEAGFGGGGFGGGAGAASFGGGGFGNGGGSPSAGDGNSAGATAQPVHTSILAH